LLPNICGRKSGPTQSGGSRNRFSINLFTAFADGGRNRSQIIQMHLGKAYRDLFTGECDSDFQTLSGRDCFLDLCIGRSPSMVPLGSTGRAEGEVVLLDLNRDIEQIDCRNAARQRVDLGNAQVLGTPDQLQIGLRPPPPGIYTVSWHVVSVDTHPTQGTFTFEVAR
jgi:hypothetical protein